MADDLARLAAGTAAVVLALTFLRGALHKLSGLPAFEGVLADYRLTPAGLLPVLAVAAPAVEAACALLLATTLAPALFTPWPGRLGALIAAAAVLVYAAAMAINLIRGRRSIDCGCGGPPRPLDWGMVARNVVLAAAVAPAAAGLGSPRSVWEAATMIGIAAAVFLGWLAAEQLSANAARMRGITAFGVSSPFDAAAGGAGNGLP